MQKLIILFFILINFLVKSQDKKEALSKFKAIAENYTAEKYEYADSLKTIPDVPILGNNERQIVIDAFKEDKYEAEKYCLLILLKVYKAQLLCCNMSYNLLDQGYSKKYNTLVYYFAKNSKYCNPNQKKSCSYLSSALVYNYAKTKKFNYAEFDKLIGEITILESKR